MKMVPARSVELIAVDRQFIAMKSPSWSMAHMAVVAAAADGLGLIASGLITFYIQANDDTFRAIESTTLIMLTAVLGPCFLFAFGSYRVPAIKRNYPRFGHCWLGWTLAIAMTGLSPYFLGRLSPAVIQWLGLWYFSGLAVLTAARFGFYGFWDYLRRTGHYVDSVAVLCASPPADKWLEWLQGGAGRPYNVIGVFDDRAARVPGVMNGIPYRGNLSLLVDYVRNFGLDMVIVVLPLSAGGRILTVLDQLGNIPVEIYFANGDPPREATDVQLAGSGLSPSALFNRSASIQWPLKQFIDWIIALGALILLAPLLLVVGIVIRLESPGPALFRQQRVGLHNNPIMVYKFRTMFRDRCDIAGGLATVRRDPRVTKIGQFLRSTSFDELPQLFNVLQGDMSIVGPRPHPLPMRVGNQYYFQAVPNYMLRHRVKPGITGQAQINGYRGLVDTVEKAEGRAKHDLEYVNHWSVLGDMAIIWRTIVHVLSTKEAF